MRDKLIEAARQKFKELEREVDLAVQGGDLEDITQKQRKLIAHGNYIRKLEKS